MANCEKCGKKLSFMERRDPVCSECYSSFGEEEIAEDNAILAKERADQIEAQRKADEVSASISRILLTTESTTDLKIHRRIDIVTAECAFGMNIFKDLFAGVRNVVGGRSEAIQRTMRDARRTVLTELRHEAHRVGGNAVVGVDLDYVDLSGSGTMVMLVASGTAVLLDEPND
ncbi:MAG: heavy metal-binding domain-containing protein [Pseudomonadota bacterium]